MTERGMACWDFQPALKLNALSARVVPVQNTERHLQSILRKIPVTRVADLTPLDYLRLPVYTAVTPLALDLTTHLGKGDDAASARVSALMEAVERVSAEALSANKLQFSSFDALRRTGVTFTTDPIEFDLPADSAYHPANSFHWIEGVDLGSGRPVLLPADLVASPPKEGILRHVDTNGLASGNTLLEAVVHAICEVIERDAISQHEFRTLFGEAGDRHPSSAAIELESIDGPARRWIGEIHRNGLNVFVHDITADIAVPTFRALVVDLAFPTPQGTMAARFPGFGTHPNAQIAALRAITEAIQSRLAAIQGARDAYNVLPILRRRATQIERMREFSSTNCRSFSTVPSHVYQDLNEDLRYLIRSLEAAGFEQIFAVDITRPDLEVPVVRIRIPGLATFVVNRRRVGQRVLRYLV